MKILVGCPISADREWAIERYDQHIQKAAETANVDIEYLFLTYKNADHEWLRKALPKAQIELTELEPAPGDHRWSQKRYEHMAALRNEMLGHVRERDPNLFFSLDSDVMLHSDAIKSALNVFQEHPEAWAVGTKCFLSRRSTRYTNAGYWVRGKTTQWHRHLSNRVVRADILIASSLMGRQAYHTDYAFHRQGEDLGWAVNIKLKKGILYFDPRVVSKHVMAPELIDVVDERVGW